MKSEEMNVVITATEVKAEDRIEMLPRYFGAFMMSVEQSIYNCMDEIAKDYNGGMWQFYVLSNGGFYMSPMMSGNIEVSVEGNYFEGLMSADALGITACLLVYSRLSFAPKASHIGQQFHLLREYALDHKEAGLIFSAID